MQDYIHINYTGTEGLERRFFSVSNKNFLGWTNGEIEYLRKNYPWRPKEEIIKIIGIGIGDVGLCIFL